MKYTVLKFIILFSFNLLFFKDSVAQPGSIDLTFYQSAFINDVTNDLVILNDDKVILVGSFTSVNGTSKSRIAMLNSDGTIDSGFEPGSGANLNLNTLGVESNGNIIIGGNFTDYDGLYRQNIARVNANGSSGTGLDYTFGTNGRINSLVIQNDGKIIIGGEFSSYSGVARNKLARINSNGSIDLTFNTGTGFNGNVMSVILQNDGKILVGGDFTSFDGNTVNRLVRLNPNGSFDSSFNPGTGANSKIHKLVLHDGKLLVAGEFSSFNNIARKSLARVDLNGVLDQTFDPGNTFEGVVYAIAPDNIGKILVGGFFTNNNGTIKNFTRINMNGTPDAGFNNGTGPNAFVKTIGIQQNGNIIICGNFTSYNGLERNRIARVLGGENFTANVSPNSNYDLSIYPNPAKNILNINTSNPNGKIEIWSVTGKLVDVAQVKLKTSVINLENILPGVYIVKYFLESKVAIKQLVIE